MVLVNVHPKVKHAMQIRQSVIAEWLKTKDLRMVQYMVGHKYVSTTERYQVNNLEDLEEALNKYHPNKINKNTPKTFPAEAEIIEMACSLNLLFPFR